jgi:protein SCO1
MVPHARTTCCSTRGSPFLAIALFCLAASTAHAHREAIDPASVISEAPRLPVIRAAPDFTLFDVKGRQVRLADLRGRAVLVAFVYTDCKSACPLLSHRMGRLQSRLAAAGLADRATLLSITVDPEHDTAEVLARHAHELRAGEAWHFLRAEPVTLRKVLSRYDEWSRRLPGGDLDHPARLHLIDAAGRVREIYSLAFFDERQALQDIAALLREKGVERR